MSKCCTLWKSEKYSLCKIAPAIVAVLLLFFANTAPLYAVDPLVDIAQPYGIATQGTGSSYSYYSPASNAIDGNPNTYNHTSSITTENWWQLELPSPTLISKIMIQGSSSNAYRLSGAAVYITDTPYTGSLDENNRVATLAGNANEQVTEFATAKSGTYLLVKGSGSNHIHLATVEVFGALPPAPIFSKTDYTLGLAANSAVNAVVGEVKATDYQGDALTYSIAESVPFAIDNNGIITLTQTLNHNVTQSYNFIVAVNDGTNNATTNVTVKILNGNGVSLQRWNGISGTSVSNLLNDAHYQDAPDETRTLAALDINESLTSNFGQKLSAILKPEQSGRYIFAIVGDDGTELRLSANDDINSATTIAARSTWSSYQNWSAAGKSINIDLEAGSIYAIEALHKEAGGAEHVSVAWKREGDTDFTVIPANQLYLNVLDAQNSKPVFDQQESLYFVDHAPANAELLITISATDHQGDTLSYSLTGAEAASFAIDNDGKITANGTVKLGSYTVDIHVVDNTHTVTKTITILVSVNIAQQYGKVTQGSDYANLTANLAIDGDLNTNNHTGCSTDGNWWQLELPETAILSQVVIHNILGQSARLNGAKVYLSTTAFTGTFDESKHIETLTSSLVQSFTYDPAKNGNYLLIKANNSNCLHMKEVQVYGELPEKPVFNEYDAHTLISGVTAKGTNVTTIPATDYQYDTLQYSIDGNVPFSIDSQGNITVDGTLIGGIYTFDVFINDGTNTTRTTVTIQATTATAINDAITSGSVANVTEQELILAAIAEIESLEGTPPLLTAMYGTEPISYTPSNRTQLIVPSETEKNVFPIVMGNKGNSLAMAGTTDTSRYAAFGMSPTELFQENKSLDFVAPFNRLLAWLLAGESVNEATLSGNHTIALSFANSDRGNIMAWIASEHPTWTVVECNTVVDLVSCYSSVDLVITGWQGASNAEAPAVKQALATTMNAGKPVLYVHTWYEAYSDVAHAIANLLNFSLPYGGNYWANDAAVWTNITEMQTSIFNDQGLGSVKTVLKHFRDADFAVDWDACTGDRMQNCNTVLSDDFFKGAGKVRSMMTALDKAKINIFTQENDYRIYKLLALIGDRFRQTISFPMDNVTTDDTVFLKSYFSEHAVYLTRNINPAQPDMGNFSRSDFSHITPTSRTVNLTSKRNFRSAGAYALPGQTFTATRNDNSDLTVKVFIHTAREGSTRIFEDNGYVRPRLSQSTHIEIKSGETLQLTSPYGGPIQLEFSANDLPVEVVFNNIGEHAYWSSSADDASFTKKLDAGEFDWAEVVTTGFEAHSTLKYMRESVAKPQWGSAQALAAGTKTYMRNYPHVLAGFKGPGIDAVPEIHDFTTTKGWTINNLDLVKHMNADQSTCGSGCSGNPYDAYWAFGPTDHGDVHELGHGLERGRFLFSGWQGHSQTNPYAYYTQSKYNETHDVQTDCQGLSFNTAFTALQSSAAQADPTAYMSTNYWANSNWNTQVTMTIQTMMTVQKAGKLENGWHLLARTHIHDREFRRADDNDTNWVAKKDSLGFSDYTRAEAKAASNNDYMLITWSTVAELDMREYLDMWGLTFSDKAKAQVASFNYPSPAKEFFVSAASGYCKKGQNGDFLAKATLPIDGTQTWPTETDDDGDGYWNTLDNCPVVTNSDQLDSNGNGQGDACDTDSDNDGATTESDVISFTGAGTGDGDGDGINDADQAHVTSVRNHRDTHWHTFRNNSNSSQSNFATDAAPLTVPTDKHLLHGTTQYDIDTAVGQSITIDVYVPKDTAIQGYYLLGNDGKWAAQSATIIHGENKTKLSFTVTEGGNFDRDATANGILKLAKGGVSVNSGLDVWPYAYRFGNVELNSPTPAKTFTVKNTGSRTINITSVSLDGDAQNEFVISNDSCNGQALVANANCRVDAEFQPTSIGTKSAFLKISTDDPDNATASIFLSNNEALEQEAERRLPPVLNSLEIPENMTAGETYTLSWSVLGYHTDYDTWIVFFDCAGITENCGSSFGTNFEVSPRISPTVVEDGDWSYKGKKSRVHHYSYDFTPSADRFDESKPIVIRFYRKNGKDNFVGNSALSLIIPGNHSENYYDNTGRRIQKVVSP